MSEIPILESLRAAFDAIPQGAVILDAERRIVWANRCAAVHMGLDPEGDRGQVLTNLVRDPELVRALNTPQTSGDVRIGTHRVDQTLLLNVRCLSDGLRLVLSHDVTDADRMETMRRDFVAHVSHEIRTPLTVLSGFVETLQTLHLQPEEQEHVLQLMQQQTARMESLVSDLLVLARLEGSPKPPIDAWMGLSTVMRAIVADGQHLSNGQHTLECDAPAGLEIAIEEQEFTSALGNLVGNAVRYTPAGGRIQVQAVLRSDGYLECRVQDNGIGIERQHLPRVTQRFYRVDRSRSRHTGGTGLGLAIVKHIITRHGGELLIESELGVGSTFTLVFPPPRVRKVVAADAVTGVSPD